MKHNIISIVGFFGLAASGASIANDICGTGDGNCRVISSGHYSTSLGAEPIPGHYWMGSQNNQISIYFRDQSGAVYPVDNNPSSVSLSGQQVVSEASNTVLNQWSINNGGQRTSIVYNVRNQVWVPLSQLEQAPGFALVEYAEQQFVGYGKAANPAISGVLVGDNVILASTLANPTSLNFFEVPNPFEISEGQQVRNSIQDMASPQYRADNMNTYALTRDSNGTRAIHRYRYPAGNPSGGQWGTLTELTDGNLYNLNVVGTDAGDVVSVFNGSTGKTTFINSGGEKTDADCQVEGNMTRYGASCRFSQNGRTNITFVPFPVTGGLRVTDTGENETYPISVGGDQLLFASGQLMSASTLAGNASGLGSFNPFPADAVPPANETDTDPSGNDNETTASGSLVTGHGPFGCSIAGKSGPMDPLLPLLAMFAMAGLWFRRSYN